MKGVELCLPGFVAEQPLGFMAALGMLRVLERVHPEFHARLGWQQRGYWRARLSVDTEGPGLDGIVEAVWRGLERSNADIVAFTELFDKNLKMSRDQLRTALGGDMDAGVRELLEGSVSELPEEEGVAARGSLQMLNGASRTDFLPCLKGLATKVKYEHVERTFKSSVWSYEDEARGGLTLRLDSSADRNHALLSDDPDNIPMTTEFGAERLAIEAFGLLPVYPGTAPRSTGFHRSGRATMFRYPVWLPALRIDEIQVLINHPGLAEPDRHRPALQRLGAELIMESQRVVVGKGKTFLGPTRAYPLR
jgi:hypothetical protein